MSKEEMNKAYIERTKKQIGTQSLRGGRKGPGSEYGSGGNYWTRENWESFTSRTKSILVEMGVDGSEVDSLIRQATSNIVFY